MSQYTLERIKFLIRNMEHAGHDQFASNIDERRAHAAALEQIAGYQELTASQHNANRLLSEELALEKDAVLAALERIEKLEGLLAETLEPFAYRVGSTLAQRISEELKAKEPR